MTIEEDLTGFGLPGIEPGSEHIDAASKLRSFGDLGEIYASRVIREFLDVEMVLLLGWLHLMQLGNEISVSLLLGLGLRDHFGYPLLFLVGLRQIALEFDVAEDGIGAGEVRVDAGKTDILLQAFHTLLDDDSSG